MPIETRSSARVSAYTKRWQADSSKDSKVDRDARLSEYKNLVNGYYDGATAFYEFGWSQSFHFCRFYPGEAFYQALARHEHYLALMMGLKPGMRVLDVGCGVGGPAREIAQFSGVNIVGINNNEYQVGRGNIKCLKAGLDQQVVLKVGDFMKLSEQFGENSFDAIYAIEATCHAPTFEGIYGEILKCLKPGGIFGLYEWCMTDDWDPSIPEHKAIAHGIELGDGIAEMRTISAARKALNTVGFEILHEEDLAERPDQVPWYYPLEGKFMRAQTVWDMVIVFRMSKYGQVITHNALWVMEKFGLLPQGTHEVGEALKGAMLNLVKGGQKKVFTPMALWVCKKPEI